MQFNHILFIVMLISGFVSVCAFYRLMFILNKKNVDYSTWLYQWDIPIQYKKFMLRYKSKSIYKNLERIYYIHKIAFLIMILIAITYFLIFI